jgi:hypothetical protein
MTLNDEQLTATAVLHGRPAVNPGTSYRYGMLTFQPGLPSGVPARLKQAVAGTGIAYNNQVRLSESPDGTMLEWPYGHQPGQPINEGLSATSGHPKGYVFGTEAELAACEDDLMRAAVAAVLEEAFPGLSVDWRSSDSLGTQPVPQPPPRPRVPPRP